MNTLILADVPSKSPRSLSRGASADLIVTGFARPVQVRPVHRLQESAPYGATQSQYLVRLYKPPLNTGSKPQAGTAKSCNVPFSGIAA